MEELPEKFDNLEEMILTLEKNNDVEVLRSFVGEVHSLKGTAGTFGLNFITTLCHNYEDYLRANSDKKFSVISNTSLAFIDLLRAYRDHFSKKGDTNIDSFNQKLNSLFISPDNVGSAPKLKFLINEDVRTINKLINEVLKKNNVNCNFSKDGYEALGRLISEKFDGLITSLETALIGGLDLSKIIRSLSRFDKKFKIILITSKDDMIRPSEIDYIVIKNPELAKNLQEVISKIL